MKGNIDFAAIGYPAVREAFNETLELCVEKLSKSEIRHAENLLDVALLDEDRPGIEEMLKDTALYSRKDKLALRMTKRPIDRIAEKLARLHDPLKSAIAARLPGANFSIFEVEAAPEPGLCLARDLLEHGRAVRIMDNSMAAMVAKEGEMLIAGRFVDLGPWHIGFGIVRPLRKSEAVALSLMLFDGVAGEAVRSGLHELVYAAALHQENLVMSALEPVILALSAAVDADLIDMGDLTAGFGALFSAKGGRKGKLAAMVG